MIIESLCAATPDEVCDRHSKTCRGCPGDLSPYAVKTRMKALENLLRRHRDDHNDRVHEQTGGDDNGCVCVLCTESDTLIPKGATL